MTEKPIDSPEAGIAALIRESFKQGYLKALTTYAWWKDGVQYVGCSVKTLKQAERDFEKERTNKNNVDDSKPNAL